MIKTLGLPDMVDLLLASTFCLTQINNSSAIVQPKSSFVLAYQVTNLETVQYFPITNPTSVRAASSCTKFIWIHPIKAPYSSGECLYPIWTLSNSMIGRKKVSEEKFLSCYIPNHVMMKTVPHSQFLLELHLNLFRSR